MKKETLTLKYIGANGGNATHLNIEFTDERGTVYTWFTASDKFDEVPYDSVVTIEAQVDHYMKGYVELKYVKIVEVE